MKTIEQLWEASCCGKINTLKRYYREESSVLNRRYKAFGSETSLIMGAFNNNEFDTVDYLISVGETITDDEKAMIHRESKRIECLYKIMKAFYGD